MKFGFAALLAAAGMVVSVHLADAADIARLEWGAFIVADDSSNGWSETKSVSSDDGRSVTMSFASMEAKADGATMESSSRLAGRYELIQPSQERISSFRIDLVGHVIKGGDSLARITVSIGTAEQTIEWPKEQPASEKFERSMVFAVPAGQPAIASLDVAISTFATKDTKDGAAYVSVSTMTVTAEPSKLALQ